MLFFGWLAACFLAVAAINLYLRYFGLPKRRNQGNVVQSVTFSGSGPSVSGFLHGSPFSSAASSGYGESVHWINSILSWIYQTQSRVPDFVESWLNALTAEAEKQSKELQIRFEGIHGSPPEFSSFRTESSSAERDFTILTTLTLKDVTFQTSTLAKSTTSKANQTVKCDVYLQNLNGQVKALANFANNELCLQLDFVSEPTMKLQIRPTRVDYTIDNVAFEKIIRAAICRASMRLDWTSRSASRPSHLRIVEPNSVERAPVQRFKTDSQVSEQPSRVTAMHMPLADSYRDKFPLESSLISPSQTLVQDRQSPLTQKPYATDIQGQYQVQGQFSEAVRDQQYPATVQGQQYEGTVQGQQRHPGIVQGQQYPIQGQQYPIQGQQYPIQGQQYPITANVQMYQINQEQQSKMTTELLSDGPKLFIKVVKANGLIDADFGNCSAYCRVHVDSPPQDFATNVIRNTVNPYWDEQFISEFDKRTKQIQFEVLDCDRQPGSDLLGKAVVLVDEIRRMPSSRQIIPLVAKPKSRTSTSGSVTVEFIFKDASELSPTSLSSPTSALSFGLGQGAAPQKQASSITQQTPSSGGSLTSGSDYSPYTSRAASASITGATQLSAHNLALTPSQPVGSKPQDSPMVVVTGVDSATLQQQKTIGAKNNLDARKKESFASTLKRKLERIKIKPRSQSADRTTSRSLREGNLLTLPGQQQGAAGATLSYGTTRQQTNRNSATIDSSSDVSGSNGTLQKPRSNSFSSSLRRIFRRDKTDKSRESSLKMPSASSSTQMGRQGGSREALVAPGQDLDRSRRENTPVPQGDRFAAGGRSDFPYSSSVPAATSPLQSR